MLNRRLLLIFLTIQLFSLLGFAQELRWPPEDPDAWLLAFVDVETTGLRAGYHEMIDIGLIYADLEGNERARMFERVLPEHLDRVSEGAVGVNGFSQARWDSLGALSKAELVQEIRALHAEVVGEGQRVLLVAFNSQFDAGFLEALFQEQGDSWRSLYFYYVLDIPSMAWAQGLRGLTGAALSRELGIEDEPHDPMLHTGITGADLNIRLYRALLDRAD